MLQPQAAIRRPADGPPETLPPNDLAMSRRRFLTLTSEGLAALSLAGLCPPVFAAGEALDSPLSVGYLTGSGQLPGFARLLERPAAGGFGRHEGPESLWIPAFSRTVRPAYRLPMGDQTLAGTTVEVRIHGLSPGALRGIPVESADLDVLFPAPPELEPELGFGALLPFFAWSLSARGVPAPSPPIRFHLPLGPDGGLDLRLRVATSFERITGTGRRATKVIEDRRFATRFTVDWEDGLPRLQRGIYLLGLGPDTWAAPARLPEPGQPRRPDLCSVVISVEPVEAS